MMSSKSFYINIVTYNNNEYLLPCMDSIYKSCSESSSFDNPIGLDIIFNGCNNDTIKEAKKEWNNIVNRYDSDVGNIHIRFTDLGIELLSFSEANNAGIESAIKAEYDYVLCLNDDTLVCDGTSYDNSKHWLKVLSEYIDDDVVCVGPQGADIDQTGSHTTTVANQPEHNGETRDYIALCCALFPSWIFEEIGLLDESFKKAYWEDTDFGVRIQKAGYRSVSGTFDGFLHYGNKTMEKMPNVRDQCFFANRSLFMDKHSKWLSEKGR